jgi:3-oxoadipate CoA-transferase alpha subunit
MIDAGMVAKMICSFPRSADPRAFTEKYLAGEIELELVPQGTLAERIRAGGAGIPAFYTPTELRHRTRGRQAHRRVRWPHVRAGALAEGRFGAHQGRVADALGNLTYRRAARNFSPLMCMAAAKDHRAGGPVVKPGEHRPRARRHARHLRRRHRRSAQRAAGRSPHARRGGLRMTLR